jgi:hypothetical protein
LGQDVVDEPSATLSSWSRHCLGSDSKYRIGTSVSAENDGHFIARSIASCECVVIDTISVIIIIGCFVFVWVLAALRV